MIKKIISLLIFLFTLPGFASFTIEVELTAPGTRSEGKRGILYYNRLKITPAAQSLTTQGGHEYYFLEPKYMWSNAGWKTKPHPFELTTKELEPLSKSELEQGYYYSEISSLRPATPANWIFMKTGLHKMWIRPELINSFLGYGSKEKKQFQFISKKKPAFLWKKKFFTSTLLTSSADSIRIVGYEEHKKEAMIYEISKAAGKIISSYPLPRDLSSSRIYPSYTLSGRNLYYYSGSMDTGRFSIYDLTRGRNVLRKSLYFTHNAPVVIHEGSLFLAYSEADHKFCHLQVIKPSGETEYHFRTRESVCELPPVVDRNRVVFFTNSSIYCFSRKAVKH